MPYIVSVDGDVFPSDVNLATRRSRYHCGGFWDNGRNALLVEPLTDITLIVDGLSNDFVDRLCIRLERFLISVREFDVVITIRVTGG